MEKNEASIRGVWIPLVTPFREGKVDTTSLRRLVDYYINCGVAGLLPLGTTGESPALDSDELELIVEETVGAARGRLPVIVGAGGSATHKVAEFIRKFDPHPGVDGFLIVVPYYNRPSQAGISRHFVELANSTSKQIVLYNIPYRTGVNLLNASVFELAKVPNIVAIKDCSANIGQTLELLAQKPPGFSVLTGDDQLFYTCMVNGGDGGILASAHLNTRVYLKVEKLIRENNHQEAICEWWRIAPLTQLLFEEPNPAPLKYCLWRQGLIASPECRLPLMPVSDGLRKRLDEVVPKPDR